MNENPEHLQLFDIIRKMLDYDPATRITLGKFSFPENDLSVRLTQFGSLLDEALRHQFFQKLPPHQRIHDKTNSAQYMSASSSRERSHSLSVR